MKMRTFLHTAMILIIPIVGISLCIGGAVSGLAQTMPSFSLWNAAAVPGTIDAGPDSAVELGVKFKSDQSGTVNGIRFYKSATNVGVHTGELWTASGTLLASATFENETSSGWQQVIFSQPISITAGTVYVASYHNTVGHYSFDFEYFASSNVDNPPLHALQDGISGGDGVYAYDTDPGCNVAQQPCFPTGTYGSANYWVDVMFTPTSAPVSLSVTPAPAINQSQRNLSARRYGNVC